ncbi:hypothetical protein NDA13_000092 [Ustilago tritici]|nr:hypothetical protein NDA13_000092 [Ustilago tritici]
MSKARSNSNSSTSSTGTDPYANTSVFRCSPHYKSDQLDDLSHGSTSKARHWSRGKKNLGEGRSHFEARIYDNSQTKLSREEVRVSLKKNKDLPTKMKKNHSPEQAAKVVGAVDRQ